MIYFEEKVRGRMFEDVLKTFPDECCGFLFGDETEGGDRNFTEIMVVDNSKAGDRRRRFEISAKDYLRAERFADENGLALLGVYHSHPLSPAIPSEHDRVAAQPYFSYIIASVYGEEIRDLTSWRLNESAEFEPEMIV